MDPVDRMFHVLVRTLRSRDAGLLSAPISVAELHQQILPYRHFRRELGLETNQEYELTLMQLLSGARGYLDVDERLRDELGRELAAPAPEPSRVRDFAESQFSVNPAALAKVPQTSTPVPAAGGATRTSAARWAPPAADGKCRYCSGDLPAARTLNFCPHCGQNVRVLHCPACGTEVEQGWKFCVACGKAVSEARVSGELR